MAMSEKEKYWEYSEAEDAYELYYAEYYDPELIVTIEKDKDSDSDYFFDFHDKFDADCGYLNAATIEDAKKEVEEIIVCDLEDKIERLRNYIEHLKEVIKDFEGDENNE